MILDLSSIRLIGMIHLLPLPGAPRFGGSRLAILEAAMRDAEALTAAGFDALLVENYGDTPFAKDDAGRHVVAEMSVIASELRRRFDVPLGVQVLRNDARASLAIAAAAGAGFVRINVHTGAMVTDQGVIEGMAHDTLRFRQAIGAGDVSIFADVHVKHAVPLGSGSFEDALNDTVQRGLADAVIVSGSGTGMKTDPGRIRLAVERCDVPVYVGSGADIDSLPDLLPPAHGLIVRTSIKRGSATEAPVDALRARSFAEEARSRLV
ncbi:MAG: BtpA/SgcQ family protein [Proteobacteria bacterium]|nr:BtpA/SgcQ family protein [Pseudomonadota bacterium]